MTEPLVVRREVQIAAPPATVFAFLTDPQKILRWMGTEATLEPHKLCGYLYGLAASFSSFFEACPVLKAEPAERASRLALCQVTARTLATGLSLLGIAAPERM